MDNPCENCLCVPTCLNKLKEINTVVHLANSCSLINNFLYSGAYRNWETFKISVEWWAEILNE